MSLKMHFKQNGYHIFKYIFNGLIILSLCFKVSLIFATGNITSSNSFNNSGNTNPYSNNIGNTNGMNSLNPPNGFLPATPNGSAIQQLQIQQQNQALIQQQFLAMAKQKQAADAQAALDAANAAAAQKKQAFDDLVKKCQGTDLNEADFNTRSQCNSVQNQVIYHEGAKN